ncbi:Cyclin-like protein [Giardia muris]|uniref:Cyclin-like protein n=1 Tax=Giardia muris TaxID=5742 RepID=A0A4Z1T4E9_GIAMU|nr:Cyclin-like protein [Giardia muris]|eukprot:TNJ30548.1 Cyclin-like protein [Giardia muris]
MPTNNFFEDISSEILKLCVSPHRKPRSKEPDIHLQDFLMHIAALANVPESCFTEAAEMLGRLSEIYVGRLTRQNIIRLTFAALIVSASKHSLPYSLREWAAFGCYFYSREEIKFMTEQLRAGLHVD